MDHLEENDGVFAAGERQVTRKVAVQRQVSVVLLCRNSRLSHNHKTISVDEVYPGSKATQVAHALL